MSSSPQPAPCPGARAASAGPAPIPDGLQVRPPKNRDPDRPPDPSRAEGKKARCQYHISVDEAVELTSAEFKKGIAKKTSQSQLPGGLGVGRITATHKSHIHTVLTMQTASYELYKHPLQPAFWHYTRT